MIVRAGKGSPARGQGNGLRLQPRQGLKGKFNDDNQALVDWLDRDRNAHLVRRGRPVTRQNPRACEASG